MRKVQVGIDLGTTNTLACCRVNGKLKLIKFQGGKTFLPSVLYVEKQEDGSIKEIVGKAAKMKGLGDPQNCISSSKTYIGLTGPRKKTWTCQEKTYTPTDVATKILEEVHKKVRKEYALEEDDIVQAVITIPAYFTSTQSDETKKAGENAGMEVLRIITEPVAAAVSAAEGEEGKIFVVDLGGGTFDVSVLEIGEKYKTLDIGGERRLGGDDFDEKLIEYFLKYIEDDLDMDLSELEASGLDYENYYMMMSKIRNAAIETKEGLSESEEYDIYIPDLFRYGEDSVYDFEMNLSREEFNELCKPLFDKVIQVIDEVVKNSAKFTKDELKKIYLVGGSCYIPKIQEDVEEYFGISPDSEHDRATQVAMGAGKIASAWNAFTPEPGKPDPFEDMLVDLISHDMGIEALGKDSNISEFSCILKEGTAYPCSFKKTYYTSTDNQETVVIKVYEKTDQNASDFLDEDEGAFDLYGSFELSGITPAPARAIPIEVTFDYDRSRTLCVTAEDTKNHNAQTVILHKGENISPSKSIDATDFYLLIDVSGSMKGNKIKQAKMACSKLIQETLDLSVHRLGIITFGDRDTLLCGLTRDRKQLILAVDRITPSGQTRMDSAIIHASDELKNCKNKKAMIIITDGAPDCRKRTETVAQKTREQGISIATIGVDGADSEYLKKIATDTNLNFKVSNIAKLSDTFGQAVENLLRL